MTKKILVTLFLIITLFTAYRIGAFSFAPILSISNTIKLAYLNTMDSFSNLIDKHFNQAKTIQKLKQENDKLKKSALVLNAFADEILKLSELKGYYKEFIPHVKTTKVISYAKLPYFQKLWIDFDEYNSSKIYGLIYNNQAAGIVAGGNKNSALALLNGDPKCSYAVYVGENKAPGIAMGLNDREMIVKYIPTWIKIEVGDKVVTSGLDGIFFAGIDVGIIKSIRTKDAYKEAIISPYFNSLNPSYFYVIKSTK